MDLFDRFLDRLEKVAKDRFAKSHSRNQFGLLQPKSEYAREMFQNTKPGSIEHSIAASDVLKADARVATRMLQKSNNTVPLLYRAVKQVENKAVNQLTKETGSLGNKLYRLIHKIK